MSDSWTAHIIKSQILIDSLVKGFIPYFMLMHLIVREQAHVYFLVYTYHKVVLRFYL
jgi:hypothetical protein